MVLSPATAPAASLACPTALSTVSPGLLRFLLPTGFFLTFRLSFAYIRWTKKARVRLRSMPLATLLEEQLSSGEAFSKASSLRVRRDPMRTEAYPLGYAAGGGGGLRPGPARRP